LNIRDVEAEPGSKCHGFINVGGRAVSSVDLPVMIVNGCAKGPTLCLTGGLHGSEYSGIDAATRLYRELDPSELRGTVLIAPVINVPAFERSTAVTNFTPSSYVCPIDEIDLIIVDPNKSEGSMSSLIVHTVFHELILKSDFYIDLHGAAFSMEIPHDVSVMILGEDSVDEASKRLAMLFPSRYVRVYDMKDPPVGVMGLGLTGNAMKKGIPSMMSEAGHSGRIMETAVDFHIKGILNVMMAKEMLEGSPEGIPPDQRFIFVERVIRTRKGGIFYPKIRAESIVSKGDVVATIRNVFGETLEELVAPINGVVLWHHYIAPVNSGDALIKIGEM
jgi:predicted deacylase